MLKFFTYIIVFFIPCFVQSQIWDIGVLGGIANYQGDLNPNFHFKFVQPAGGIFIRKNFNPVVSYRTSLYIGSVSANDAVADGWQNNRNLNFSSNIVEASGHFEFNFLPYITGFHDKRFTTYVFTGFSVFYFNPKNQIKGKTFYLQKIGTEGQGSVYYPDKNRYLLAQFAIPFGGGFKFSLGNHIGCGLEFGMRKTFTDYLDDVSTTYPEKELIQQKKDGDLVIELSDNSLTKNTTNNDNRQRGNSKDKDWYMIGGLTIFYTLKSEKCGRAFQKGYRWE